MNPIKRKRLIYVYPTSQSGHPSSSVIARCRRIHVISHLSPLASHFPLLPPRPPPSGGTASNLVTLIANGDVALSVSMTTVSTLLAAVVTGPLTKFLVGSLVEISAGTLMRATAQVVFFPVGLGLLLNTRAKGVTRRLAPYTPLL